MDIERAPSSARAEAVASRGNVEARDMNIMSKAMRVFMDSGIGAIRRRLSQRKAKRSARVFGQNHPAKRDPAS